MGSTSRRVRNGLAVLKNQQRGQCARLSIPRQKSREMLDQLANESPRGSGLRNSVDEMSNSRSFLRRSN